MSAIDQFGAEVLRHEETKAQLADAKDRLASIAEQAAMIEEIADDPTPDVEAILDITASILTLTGA